MRQHSLKQRMTVLALLTVAVVWFTASAITYFNARHEIDEVLDAHLSQQAALLASQATHELNELEDDHVHLMHKYSRRVAFQIWDANGRLRLHSDNADRQPLATQRSGFSDSVMDGNRWRVFSAQDESGTFLIHVAERVHDREEMARAVVGSLLMPLLASLPLLAVLLWLAVRQGLQPLDRLAAEVPPCSASGALPRMPRTSCARRWR